MIPPPTGAKLIEFGWPRKDGGTAAKKYPHTTDNRAPHKFTIGSRKAFDKMRIQLEIICIECGSQSCDRARRKREIVRFTLKETARSQSKPIEKHGLRYRQSYSLPEQHADNFGSGAGIKRAGAVYEKFI